MRFDKNFPEKKWVSYTIATCSAVLLYVLLGNLPSIIRGIGTIYDYVSPVIIGVIIAYVLDPIAKLVQRSLLYRIKQESRARAISCGITLVGVTVLLIVLMVALIPQLIASIGNLISNAGSYASRARSLLSEVSAFAAEHNVDISSVTEVGNNIVGTITRLIPSNLNSIIGTSFSIGASMFNAVISFILAVYFLLDKERILTAISRLMRSLLPRKQFSESLAFWRRSNSILVRYVAYDLLDGAIVAIANYIFMKIAGMQYGMLISVVVGVTNLAPTFGPILGGAVGAFILVLINPWHALWFLIFTFILQTVDGYILKPRLFGGSLGVSSVWILIMLIVGGRIFGVAGILFAIPIAAIISFIVSDFISRKEKERRGEDDSPAGPAVSDPMTAEESHVKANKNKRPADP